MLGTESISHNKESIRDYALRIARGEHSRQSYIDLILATREIAPDESKDAQLVRAASNAISILNYGSLSNLFPFWFGEVRDWSRIRVPGANLNYAQAIECNFDSSDLSHCTMLHAVLTGSTFHGADMRGVSFGCKGPLLGHKSPLTSIAFSPDGTLLASGSYDTAIRIWDVESGHCTLTIEPNHTMVKSVCFSPDRNLLAAGYYDQALEVWDVRNGQRVTSLTGLATGTTCLSFSPDGKFLAASSLDSFLRVWSMESNECILKIQTGNRRLFSVTFSPDGVLLASGGMNQEIQIWSVESGVCTSTLRGHSDRITTLHFGRSGTLLASGSADSTARLWDLQTGEIKRILEGHRGEVTCVTLSPDESVLASASADSTIRLCNSHTGECVATLHGHAGSVNSVCFSANGEWLASGAHDHAVVLWRVKEVVRGCMADPPRQIDVINCADVHSHAVVPVGGESRQPKRCPVIVTGSKSGEIRLWGLQSGMFLDQLDSDQKYVTSVCWSPDGRFLATSANDCDIRLWDLTESKQPIRRLSGHDHSVTCITFSPDGKMIASASLDRRIGMWDRESGECRYLLEGDSRFLASVCFSPDGTVLASSGSYGTILMGPINWRRESQFRRRTSERSFGLHEPTGVRRWRPTVAST